MKPGETLNSEARNERHLETRMALLEARVGVAEHNGEAIAITLNEIRTTLSDLRIAVASNTASNDLLHDLVARVAVLEAQVGRWRGAVAVIMVGTAGALAVLWHKIGNKLFP